MVGVVEVEDMKVVEVVEVEEVKVVLDMEAII